MTIAINHRYIHCQTCSHDFHIKCNNTDIKSYQKIKDGTIPEICKHCLAITPGTNESNDMPFSSISDTEFQTINLDIEDLSHLKNNLKITCTICNKTIARNHRKITCEICSSNVHIKCNLTDVTSFNNIIKNKLPQKCKNCDPSQVILKPNCCVCNKKIA